MSKFVDRIGNKAFMSTMKTVTKGPFSITEKALKKEGFNPNKKTYSRDEVRQGFKIAQKLDNTKKTGWQVGTMFKRAVDAHSELQQEEKQAVSNRTRRLQALEARAYRPRTGDAKKLQGSSSRVSQNKIDTAKSATGKATAAAAPTLHSVPNVGPNRTDPTQTQVTLADVTDPKQNQLDELVNPESVTASNTPAISDEEFKKLKEEADEIAGRQILS